MHRRTPTLRPRHLNVNFRWHSAAVRWVRCGFVALLLAAPVLVVVAVAWPDDRETGAVDDRTECEDGSGPDGALVAGDRVTGELAFGGVARCRSVGEGVEVRIAASSRNADLTLTVVGDDGEQLAYNDDDRGLDPAVTVDLDDGQAVDIEVRELGGAPTSFTLTVAEADG